MLTRLLNAPARMQTAIAICLFILAIGLAASAVYGLVKRLVEQRETLIATREHAGRLAMLARTDLSGTEAFSDAGNDGPSLFMNAPSVVIARAGLQERINTIAQANDVLVASAGNLPDLKEGNSTLIGLRVDFSGVYEDVNRMLLAIETGVPPLIVKELNVRSAGVDQLDRAPELSAQVRVYGAIRVLTPEGGIEQSP